MGEGQKGWGGSEGMGRKGWGGRDGGGRDGEGGWGGRMGEGGRDGSEGMGSNSDNVSRGISLHMKVNLSSCQLPVLQNHPNGVGWGEEGLRSRDGYVQP